MAQTNHKLAARLRSARARLDLSVEEVARRVSVSEKTVRRWEQSAKGIKTANLAKIAEVYGEDIGDLVGEQLGAESDVKRGTSVPGHTAEPRSPRFAEVVFDAPQNVRTGRIRAQEVVLELTKNGSDESFIEWARRFVLNAANYPPAANDEQKLRQLERLSRVPREIVPDLLTVAVQPPRHRQIHTRVGASDPKPGAKSG